MEIKRIILIGIGFVMLGLGAIGLFLPVLPTTPFVLVAAACFSSNPKLAAWLARSKYMGEFIRNYKSKSGVSKGTKIRALLFLWGMLILSAFFVQSPILWLVLAAVGICVSLHILLIKNKAKEE